MAWNDFYTNANSFTRQALRGRVNAYDVIGRMTGVVSGKQFSDWGSSYRTVAGGRRFNGTRAQSGRGGRGFVQKNNPLAYRQGRTQQAVSEFFSKAGYQNRFRLGNLAKGAAKAGLSKGALGFAGVFAAIGIASRMAEGESALTAVPREVGSGLAGTIGYGIGAALGTAVLGPLGGFVGGMIGASIAAPLGEGIANVGIEAAGAVRRLGQRAGKMQLGGQNSAAFNTFAAATMRQRSLNEMNRSGQNMRSLLGREATLMHMRGMAFA